MKWFKRKSYPQFWQAYASCFKHKQEQDLNHIRFVVFDTETTGLSSKTDRILSIGCIAINDLKINVADQLEIYVKQDHFNTNTVKIHGLLKEGKNAKYEESQAIIAFLDYVKDAVLIAHHAAFDVAMINAALKRLDLPRLKNKVLDTGHLFQKAKLDTSKAHFSLDELSQRFNIPLHDRHTASGDAYITSILFLKLISKLSAKDKVKLKDLLQPINRIGLL
ncbi:DNA polymerase-3 subunit epsilon [Winogradskyella wandonensis]|uniref:DNA polymerase-3 subunit epsilon n=1 Tax=Winogradskyella wandonensis TaxID=1442586 RepID=A0A4R1KZA8_9FLAO|nr:3'-5' exonuclease [Winogradskyella wandonensis]TCK69389.1 DNA polymerase-3 subunit epsilon [Winogradskyella wandonensis]